MTIALAAGGVKHEDLGPDEKLARRILIEARRIAPWLATAGDGSELQKDVLAILDGVYKRAVDIGTGVVASQGRNGTNRSLRDIRDAFFTADIRDLRSLNPDAPADAATAGMPLGSFPTDRPLSRLFPEGPYG